MLKYCLKCLLIINRTKTIRITPLARNLSDLKSSTKLHKVNTTHCQINHRRYSTNNDQIFRERAAEDEEQPPPEEKPQLYPDHIPTTDLQKGLLTIGSAFLALTDPFRDDMVAVLGETTGSKALTGILEKMRCNEEGQEILIERPRINSSTVNFDKLRAFPPNTLGNVYITFMDKNNITADSRKPVHFVDDEELAYVLQRYREVHDIVHALLDQPTNMLGEVTVKWVEAIQTELPMCIGAAIFGAVRLKPKQTIKYTNVMLPWALDCGKNASFLMNIYFEKRWEQDIDELRAEINIPPIPEA